MNQSTRRLRPATADDIRAVLGCDLPEEWAVADWVEGDVLEEDGRIVGYGVVTQDRLGRIWAWVNRGAASPVTLHRGALRMLQAARQAGVSALFALCRDDAPDAGKWVRRLGFKPTDTVVPNGRVWVCDLST